MKNEHSILETLLELKREIQSNKKFGIDFSNEQKEADEIEKSLIVGRMKLANDNFREKNIWKDIHTSTIEKWDLVIHNDIVCRMLEIVITNYDRGSDTYNYRARLKSIFFEEEFEFDFGYYETIKALRNL